MIRCKKVNPLSSVRARETLDLLQMAVMPDDFKCEYKPQDLWWIVERDGLPVAYACTRPVSAHWWYLARVGVLKEARGNGLQKKLIRLRCNAAKKAGGVAMITDTRADNYPSSNSLIACGFRLYEPVDRWAFVTGLYWMKDL